MANVNANVNVTFQTQQAAAQLRKLSADISRFNQQTFAANSAAAQQQRALNQALLDGVRTSGQFRTSIVPMTSAVENFSNSIEKGKLTLGQYTRYAASQLPGMRRVFTREFDMINQVAESRVRKLNTQFIALGESANGMRTALAMTPTALDQFAARSAIALQRQQIFNRLLRDGSTQLLNWGKNTQWAGRQLMVGFTIPLGLLGAQAAKVFRELEAEAVNFKKVYGDMFTTDVEVEQNLAAIKELSVEMTKYGQTAQQTMQLANTAAQAGQRGAELMAATRQATRLAVLGQMEQNQAIETTISLQTAFALSNEQLAESINFLNSVENQTILSLQDVSEAIPRVASVIKGFGGDVGDLAVLLVAMKEGGVSAAEGANALKNSMARIIAPTKNALETSAKYGIALQDIVNRNDGKIVPLFQELAKALEAVGGQERQEILSAIFGKFQYARIGTLLSNIAKDGSQAATAIELTGVAARDLAATAERELGAVEDAIGTKFTAALEKAKIALAPVGGEFLKALTPVLESVAKILAKFDELPSGIKTAIVAATAIIGGIAPIVLMVVGLVANGIANIAKFILFLRKQIATLRGNGEQFKMYTSAELEAAAAAASLEGKTSSLTRTMLLQRPAIETLITLYQRLASSAAAAAAAMPATMGGIGIGRIPGLPKGGLPTLPQARNAGGPIFMANGKKVPGSGNTDKVPAMLTPGEFVVNKEATQSNIQLLDAINSGKVNKYALGGMVRIAQLSRMPKPITNPNQQRAIEGQLTNWLDMKMRNTNVRELGRLLGRRQKETELYRGITMRSSDSGFENRFPKETQDALYRFARTGDPNELSGLIGQPVAISPRSFSTSKKVAETFAREPVSVGDPRKDRAPLILKLKNDQGIFGFKPTERIGAAKQSSKFVKEKRFYSRGSQNEREIVPVGDPLIGKRVDAVVGRWGFDGKNVFIDAGAKLSRKEISRATKELDAFTSSRFTPTQDIVKANRDLQKLEAIFQRAKINPGRTSSKELGDLGAQLLSQSNIRFNAGTRKDKRLADSIAKRTAKMLEETSVMFNRARSFGMNKGGIAPEMAPTIGSPLVKEWAQRRARTLTDTLTRQSSVMKANRGRIVPGTGNADTVPAMLTPGEFVVNKEATRQNLPLIKAINDGKPVSYLNDGTQAKVSYKAPAPIRRQTESMVWATEKREIAAAKRAAAAWKVTEKQIQNATLKSASHIVSDKGPMKTWIGRNLMPDLMAINQYMNRVPKVASGILKETRTIESIAKKTGLSTARVTQELTNFSKGIHPVTTKSAKVMAEVSRIDERASKKVIADAEKAGKSVAKNAANRFGASVSGGYLASMTRAALDVRTQTPGGGPYGMRYVTPPEGFVTSRAGTPLPKINPSAPRAPLTYTQANSTQAMARQIMRNAPGTTAPQALQIARLQQMGGGGGGGRTPTFLGMPGMGDPDGPGLTPRQTRMQRINAGVGKIGMGAGMGLSMAAMLPMMKQDEQGKFMGMDAGTAMLGLMGGGMLLSIAPMLGAAALPVIALGATAAAVGLGLKVWRNKVDEAAKKTGELGANAGGVSNALNTMANLFGEKTPAQRRTQMQLGFTAKEQEQSFGEFQNYLGSEFGQQFLKDLENATAAERFTKLSSYLANAIAGGILDEEKAKLFAKTVASSLNDSVLGSSVIKAIEDQKVGAEGILELAEKRFQTVEKSVSMQRLRSQGTIEETDASFIIGAGIQIIQDFSNAAALAKEEYIAGTRTFEEYRLVVNRSREAQEKYTIAMQNAFTKTSDFGATMQSWKDQLTLSGKSPEVVAAFERSVTKTESLSPSLGRQLLNPGTTISERTRAIMEQALGGQASLSNMINAAWTGQVKKINTELLSAISVASKTGEYNDADLTAIAENIVNEPQGRLAEIFKEYGANEQAIGRVMFEKMMEDTEIAGLDAEGQKLYTELAFQFDKESGDYAEYITFINNIPEELRQKVIVDFEGLTAEGRQRIVADQALLSGMFGMETATRIQTQSPEYMRNLRAAGRKNIRGRGGVEYDETINEELTRIYENLGEAAGETVDFAISIELRSNAGSPEQLSDILSRISGTIEFIEENIPKDIQIGLGIDVLDSQQMYDMEGYTQQLLGLSEVVKVMKPEEQEVAARIAISVVDGKNKPLTGEELISETSNILKAIKNLDSKDLKTEKEAMITVIQSFEDQDGQRITPQKAEEFLQEWIGKFGQKKVSMLNEVEIQTLVNLDTQIENAEKALAGLRASRVMMDFKGVDTTAIDTQIEDLEGAINSYELSKEQVVTGAGNRSKQPTGGGGGTESPLKGFTQNILEQFNMWVDASAKMTDLNNARTKFVDMVLKGDGIFNRLSKVKGIDPMRLQEILGMGPEGVQEFLDKYVRGNKLTKAGKGILDAAAAAGINETVAMTILGTRQTRQQRKAAESLAGRGASSALMQQIAGDSTLSNQFMLLEQDYQRALESGDRGDIKKAKKNLDEFIDSQLKSLKAEKRREEALKSTAQKSIEANNDMIEANNKYMDEGDKHFEREQRRIEANYRDRIKAAEDQIQSINEQIDAVNDLIDEQEKLNRSDQNRIRDLERQKEMLNRQLEELDRANELDERRIEALSREDEMRGRVEEALSRELELMSRVEEDIRESYEKRIEALDEVARVNDYIINQQKQQLGLSRAISEGDIYAATQAAQDMRASSAGFAVEQVRQGLETGMENQIAGLRTGGGLTRGEAEAQIQAIQDQSYQTSLQIRDIEDAIYNRNLQMIPIKDQIRNIDLQVRDIQDQIYERETTILNIQTTRLEPLQSSLKTQQDILDSLNNQVDTEIESIKFNEMNAEQWADKKLFLIDQNESLENQNTLLQEEDDRLVGISKKWNKITKQIKEANEAARKRLEGQDAIEAATATEIKKNKALTDTQRNEQLRQNIADRQAAREQIESDRRARVDALLASGANLSAFSGGLMKYAMGGMIANPSKFTSNEAPPIQKRSYGGMIFGSGTRDSIAAMLTPGEFVIRKAMVDKYGIPMMESLNQGSFALPKYDLGSSSPEMTVVSNNMVSSINAPVYNTYDMKFAINGTNQSADEIANKVMFKMKQIQDQGIRGNRGY